MGDGTKEKPYTRKDVQRRIKANGGTAEGLDLSGKVFEDGINLRELNLSRIILKNAIFWDIESEDPTAGLEGAHLEGVTLSFADLEGACILSSHLEEADLFNANLKGALLTGAHLEGVDLSLVSLEGAKLRGANLRGTLLAGVKLSPETMLSDVEWGNYVLREETAEIFSVAGMTYRQLKQWHTNAGMYDIAGKFFFREMTAGRKMLNWWPNPLPRAWSKFLSLICGYGEKPERVIIWAASVVVGLALIYFIIGSVWEWSVLWWSLYFSAVSFTALGYGSWLHVTNDWVRGIGAFESFIGVFSMALFLVTFIRKMTR